MASLARFLTPDDRPAIALHAAIDFYLKHCEDMTAAGPRPPYSAHVATLLDLLPRLHGGADPPDAESAPGSEGA